MVTIDLLCCYAFRRRQQQPATIPVLLLLRISLIVSFMLSVQMSTKLLTCFALAAAGKF